MLLYLDYRLYEGRPVAAFNAALPLDALRHHRVGSEDFELENIPMGEDHRDPAYTLFKRLAKEGGLLFPKHSDVPYASLMLGSIREYNYDAHTFTGTLRLAEILQATDSEVQD